MTEISNSIKNTSKQDENTNQDIFATIKKQLNNTIQPNKTQTRTHPLKLTILK